MSKPYPTSPVKRLLRIIRAEKQEVRSIYVFAIFQGLVSLSLPLGIQSIINFLQAGALSTSWYVLVLFVLSGIFFAGLLQIKQLEVTETIEQRLFANVSFRYAQRVPKISIQSLKGKYIPEVLNRFFEVPTIQKGIAKILIDFSAAIIQIVFGLLLLSLYNGLFAILGILLALVLYIMFRLTGPSGLRTSLEESKYKYEVAHWLQEVGRTLATFKLAGDTKLPMKKTDELTGKYLTARNKHFKILVQQYKALIGFKILLASSLIILGSVLVIQKEINIGQFVAAEIVVLLLINSVEKIILNMDVVYDVLTSLDKLGAVAEIKTERETGEQLPQDKTSMGLSLTLKNVSLVLEHSTHPVLDDVNLEIESGQIVCIGGSNGSGKTVLLKTISGFYEQFSGSIAFNHMPIGNLNLSALRSDIGENFSEQEIFRGTIAENISCGREDIDLDEVLKAAKISRLESFIETLPGGYNSVLQPGGQGLPGSIIRKIILARCFAGKPRLMLIEDTVLGHSEEERKLFFDILFDHCKNITTIIVTNDKEVAMRSDKVFRMESGKLIPITNQG